MEENKLPDPVFAKFQEEERQSYLISAQGKSFDEAMQYEVERELIFGNEQERFNLWKKRNSSVVGRVDDMPLSGGW